MTTSAVTALSLNLSSVKLKRPIIRAIYTSCVANRKNSTLLTSQGELTAAEKPMQPQKGCDDGFIESLLRLLAFTHTTNPADRRDQQPV